MSTPTSFFQEIRGVFLSTVFAIIQAIALGLFAYYLKDRVDVEMKERAQTVSSIKEMQGILDNLKLSTDAGDRAENIVRLAMFGEDAIPVLVNLSAANTKYDQTSMLAALNLLIVEHEKSVCDGVRGVLARRSLFDDVRMRGIERYKTLNCPERPENVDSIDYSILARDHDRDLLGNCAGDDCLRRLHS